MNRMEFWIWPPILHPAHAWTEVSPINVYSKCKHFFSLPEAKAEIWLACELLYSDSYNTYKDMEKSKNNFSLPTFYFRLFAWNFAPQYLQVNQQEHQKLKIKNWSPFYLMIFVLSMNSECNFSLNKHSEFSSLPQFPKNKEADISKIVMSHFLYNDSLLRNAIAVGCKSNNIMQH